MYDKKFKENVCEEYINTSITRKEICKKYNVNLDTLKTWLRRLYPDQYATEPNARRYKTVISSSNQLPLLKNSDYKEMTKEEMQIELIKKDFEIERLKKKYQVIQDPITGEKQYVIFKDLNTK